jgi:predicted enzyme related to lactoylglutathione lyase
MAVDHHPTLGNGKICYIEMPSIDISQSASFYREVFGWQIRERGDGDTSFDDAVGEVSGRFVQGRKVVSETGLLVYIMVDNAQASIELIKKHGGKIVQPIGMDAPEITARFSDPAGNILGIYQEPSAQPDNNKR